MDYLNSHDFSVILQVILSGLAFGIIHLMWGIKNIKAGENAFISASLLGFALAIVYLVSERSLAPCSIFRIQNTLWQFEGMPSHTCNPPSIALFQPVLVFSYISLKSLLSVLIFNSFIWIKYFNTNRFSPYTSIPDSSK
tara:strand:+ start:32 stop:448 length:417 start_codon:yes stop_codon:yes gene_type:complete